MSHTDMILTYADITLAAIGIDAFLCETSILSISLHVRIIAKKSNILRHKS